MTRRNLTALAIVGGVVLVAITAGIITSIVQNFSSIMAWLQKGAEPSQVIACSDSAVCSVVHPIVYGIILIFLILTGFAYTTLLERKILAWMQHRSGPNRVGPGGMLQPAADGIKLVFKEDIIPDKVDKPVYYLAPMLKATPVMILAAVIPLGPPITVPGLNGEWYRVPLGLSDVNVGILYLLGITSLATYGMVLAGWSSNNKYAMLGGLRASAQMISYELSMGLTLAVPVMIVGSMALGDIIDAQRNVWEWFVFQNPLAAGILLIALFAEVSRAPFDLTEAEQELTAGYMTEYSGMKFALFMMAEYVGMIAVSMIAAATFFGGYHLIPVDSVPILGPVFFIGKVVFFLTLFIWARATLPRIRYDRLMNFGWKVLIPLALVSVAWTAIAIVIGDVSGSPIVYGAVSTIFLLIVLAGGYAFLNGEAPEGAPAARDVFDDPTITGKRNGLGWALLTVLGGLIAIPFGIVNGTIRFLDSFGRAAEGPPEETAIVPSDQGGD